MTGQGETVQLFNRVGATGFRGPEGSDSPPSHSIYMKSLSSARCSQLKPWAEGERGAMDLGRCSHPCLLQGYIHRECSARLPVSPLLRAGCSPPCRVDAFPLAHSVSGLSFWLEDGCPSSYMQSTPSEQHVQEQHGRLELAMMMGVLSVRPVPEAQCGG